ncbi:inositol monophosphatase family protein [Marinibactrum halimedae]|uniref:Inositol-1-monophosphatase n=1 Tax=Marinibactrum halimedae TaxID=1444977 RepID=A0AA37T3L1_9GAMM|nr:inositol monophosphatase family protein [Marinibactrum halimedae]MCD9458440.1 inositol monophosphatase [Marinibactrum halimedae]GLS26138.1 inositol-1-monophosphatase [Marinibactrum halimedae]
MEPMLTMALRAARKAGELMERALERVDLLAIEEKGRNDFVTEIDKASEKEIVYHLKKAYPEHNILGEEGGYRAGRSSDGSTSDYEWVIDPLDGTTNFIHGIPHFAISIACKYKGKVQHAVVLDPIKREEFTASRGKGAALNGRRIRVTDRKSLNGALIGTGIPFSGPALDNINPYLDAMKEIASQTSGLRRPGAAALDLAYVAAGRFDGFFEMYLKEWDIAAGALLVQEAGGLISDFKGGIDYLQSGHVVCGSPKVFKPLLQTVGKHLKDIK